MRVCAFGFSSYFLRILYMLGFIRVPFKEPENGLFDDYQNLNLDEE
jgi:hypothetical protein